jgi:hypothetical protein
MSAIKNFFGFIGAILLAILIVGGVAAVFVFGGLFLTVLGVVVGVGLIAVGIHEEINKDKGA